MKGFVVFSWLVCMILFIVLPFAYQDMGWFGISIIVVAGMMPLGSAILGLYYWRQLDDPEIQLKILQ